MSDVHNYVIIPFGAAPVTLKAAKTKQTQSVKPIETKNAIVDTYDSHVILQSIG